MRARAMFPMLLLALVDCSRDKRPNRGEKSAPAASAHTDEHEHESIPKRVRLTPNVIKDAQIKTAPAVREALAATLSLSGEVAADPDRSARVASPVSGRIEQVAFKEGSPVKKGDILAIVRVPDIGKARAAYAATMARAASARANADRLQALTDKRLASAQEVTAARAEADALEAEARAAGEHLQALGMGAGGTGSQLVLRAPISGVVIARDAVVGQPVTPEVTIASIAELSEVWFLARVFEKDLGRLRLGAAAEVQLNAYAAERFPGTIEYLGKQIDPVARTVTARIRLTNASGQLRIGLFGAARVATGDGTQRAAALVVPRSALTDIGGKTIVFVRQADDDFETHEVVIGDASLGKVEILSGLREGESVVTDGVFTLKSIVLKGTMEAD